MVFDVFVTFNGNCKEAVEYYAEIFKQDIPKMMTFGDAPAMEGYEVKEEEKDRVCYTELKIGSNTVMFSDCDSTMEFVAGNNITLSIGANEEEIRNLYNKLKEGGQVIMELQETFWSKLYGMVTDKFGITWQLCLENGEWKL